MVPCRCTCEFQAVCSHRCEARPGVIRSRPVAINSATHRPAHLLYIARTCQPTMKCLAAAIWATQNLVKQTRSYYMFTGNLVTRLLARSSQTWDPSVRVGLAKPPRSTRTLLPQKYPLTHKILFLGTMYFHPLVTYPPGQEQVSEYNLFTNTRCCDVVS